jgi:ABC-type multidrug transport system permease subunit
MFTASYECTFATFVRLEFQKSYDGMVAAPVTINDLFVGEILWAGSKGLFFSACVVLVMSLFGAIPMPMGLLAVPIGFLTGAMFGALALLVTSFVQNINHFNFYFTGFLSPMFFFSGTVFPLDSLPRALRPFAEIAAPDPRHPPDPLARHRAFLARATGRSRLPDRRDPGGRLSGHPSPAAPDCGVGSKDPRVGFWE